MGRHLIRYSQHVSVQQGVKHPRRVGVLREIPIYRPRDAGKPAGDWRGCCMLQSTAPILFKGRAAAHLQDLGTYMSLSDMSSLSSLRCHHITFKRSRGHSSHLGRFFHFFFRFLSWSFTDTAQRHLLEISHGSGAGARKPPYHQP